MSLNLIELRTPSFVLSEMRMVDNMIKSLIADVARSQVGSAPFRETLKKFAEEWTAFFNDHDNGLGAWFARGTSPVFDKTREYKHRTMALQSTFQAAGGNISMPTIDDREGRVLPWWAVAGITAGAITWVLHKTRERQSDRDALAPRQITFQARR